MWRGPREPGVGLITGAAQASEPALCMLDVSGHYPGHEAVTKRKAQGVQH